jgi:hypothetical protein
MCLELLERDVDRLIQLRVLSRRHVGRPLLDLDVGRDTLVLDAPAVLGVEAQIGRGDHPTVHQPQEAQGPHQPAPGSTS